MNQTGAEVLAQYTSNVVSNNFVSQSVFAAGMQDDNINEEVRSETDATHDRAAAEPPATIVGALNVPPSSRLRFIVTMLSCC